MHFLTWKELISIINGLLTYMHWLATVGVLNIALIILFGCNNTVTVRKIINMLIFAFIPLLRVYKSKQA